MSVSIRARCWSGPVDNLVIRAMEQSLPGLAAAHPDGGRAVALPGERVARRRARRAPLGCSAALQPVRAVAQRPRGWR